MKANICIKEVTVYTTFSCIIKNRAPLPTLQTTFATVTCFDGNDDILLALC